MDINLTSAECKVVAENVFDKVYTNICTGEVLTVAKGTADITSGLFMGLMGVVAGMIIIVLVCFVIYQIYQIYDLIKFGRRP